MYTLTPDSATFLSSVMLLFLMGLVFFTVAFFVMMFMFAWTYKDVMKHGKKIVVMLLISLAIPFTVGALTQQTNVLSNASATVTLDDLEVKRVEDDTVIVQFTTNEPVIAYLEYKGADGQIVPVLPTGSTDPSVNHYFRVDNAGEKADLYIMLNGNKYTLNGKPIQITE